MAKYLLNAKHPELKKMGQDIIASQQKEIDQMKSWQKQWGYANQSASEDNAMREHCKMMPQM